MRPTVYWIFAADKKKKLPEETNKSTTAWVLGQNYAILRSLKNKKYVILRSFSLTDYVILRSFYLKKYADLRSCTFEKYVILRSFDLKKTLYKYFCYVLSSATPRSGISPVTDGFHLA